MKVALNPAELRLIVDALDDKRQFQLQSGRAGGAGKGGLRTLLHLQRPKRFRIVSERSTQELVPKKTSGLKRKKACLWPLMTVQEAVAFLFQQKEDHGAACSRSSQVSGIVSSALAVELFRYRYNAVDGLPTS